MGLLLVEMKAVRKVYSRVGLWETMLVEHLVWKLVVNLGLLSAELKAVLKVY